MENKKEIHIVKCICNAVLCILNVLVEITYIQPYVINLHFSFLFFFFQHIGTKYIVFFGFKIINLKNKKLNTKIAKDFYFMQEFWHKYM